MWRRGSRLVAPGGRGDSERERGARANETSVRYKYDDARELVVLAAGNEYLLTIAAATRVDAAQAQVESAQALSNKAHDQQTAGLVPAIDALRAQVELQTRQQQLIVARNSYAKQKLALSRTIGPVMSPFESYLTMRGIKTMGLRVERQC